MVVRDTFTGKLRSFSAQKVGSVAAKQTQRAALVPKELAPGSIKSIIGYFDRDAGPNEGVCALIEFATRDGAGPDESPKS